MRLIQQTKKTYVLFSIVIFIVSSIVIYFSLKTILDKRQDEKLLWDKDLIAQKIKYEYPLPIFDVEDFESTTPIRDTLYFKDTLIYQLINGVEKYETYRQLTSIETLHNKTYKIITRSSKVRNRDFFITIVLSVGIVIILLIAAIYTVNTILMNYAWLPFYENIEILKGFSIEKNEPIALRGSNVEEFQELNQSIEKLTGKLSSDFRNLKEFTENASHEMQTPLAIMQTKAEYLLQSDNLKRSQIQQIKAIYIASKRLSKLNKTLLLLSKIENEQFTDKEDIFINDVIEKHLELLEDFIENKKITVEKNFAKEPKIKANTLLFDMVISNLIGNAIKHNIEKGSIAVVTSDLFVSFTNTGLPPNIPSDSLFERFRKDSKSADSFGLGLAIVKKVCETNNWQINHTYIDNQHNITIYF